MENVINDNFNRQRLSTFFHADNSIKGSIDRNICDLIVLINSLSDYYTTSSCSGRISITNNSSGKQGRLINSYHDPTPSDKIIEELVTDGDFSISFEPFILHIQCRNLEKASQLLSVVLNEGFKNSGLVIGKSKKINLAIRNTSSIHVPLNYQLVSNEYVKYIVDILNEALKKNNDKLYKFTKFLTDYYNK
ncbi:unnamed protein product [Gordionus sp. m RMFG-2023]|uniref:tRNA wybutosine-synthesizing protein 3 homolog n=1 Tax=Gordionus sp. m RMFG-2023 TaxID=3053472 RepID=UPI0030E2D917